MITRITRSTIKSFIKKNEGKLIFKKLSNFDGMQDMVDTVKDSFHPARKPERVTDYNLGVDGAWFVGQSRDYFKEFKNDDLIGYEVSNCCGSFILAIKQN
ncbi:MAG: hypothetical protein PHO75_02235 [Candidatus Shapirobacteria bacterium]|nr:hypothetical protein [Candidatus Shapirobacteria bacterium]